MSSGFAAEEHAERRRRVGADLAGHGLGGLLCRDPGVLYWLSDVAVPGDDGGCWLFLDSGGGATLLVDAAERARMAGPAAGVGVRVIGRDNGLPEALTDLLVEVGCKGARLGVIGEDGSRPLPAVDGMGAIEDVTGLITRHRMRKSPSEMARVRRAAGLADDALDAALASLAAAAGAADVLAVMRDAALRGGGDAPAHGGVIAPGVDAAGAADQLNLEWAGSYHRYHAVAARPVIVGSVRSAHRAMHAIGAEALIAAIEACVPGHSSGDVFAAQAAVLDAARPGMHYPDDCGGSLGASFAPDWMHWPPLARGGETVLLTGMVLFIRIDLFDPDSGRRMVLGETIELSEAGAVRLHRRDSSLLVIPSAG